MKQIVDNTPAMLGLSANHENAIALDLDHRSICKFGSENDGYEQLSDDIIGLVQDAIDHANAQGLLGSPDLAVSFSASENPPSPPLESLPSPGMERADSNVDTVSMMTSIHESTQSLTLSDNIEEDDRPRSSSTANTSAPSVPSSVSATLLLHHDEYEGHRRCRLP